MAIQLPGNNGDRHLISWTSKPATTLSQSFLPEMPSTRSRPESEFDVEACSVIAR